jgi:tetratricopeptide (TPR) repeat protein
MQKTIKSLSLALAVLLLAAVAVPFLAGQQMDEKDQQIMQGFRATRADLQKGEEQFNKKQYDKAEQSFLKVLLAMPENAEASYFLAETCYQKGEFEKGLEAIEAAEKNYPNIQRLISRRRMSMSTQGSPEQEKLMQQIQALRGQLSPGLPEVQRQTIQAEIASKQAELNAQRQKDLKKENSEQKVEVVTIPAEYSYAHGNLLFRLKRYDEALAQYEKTIQADPAHGGAYNNIANIYYMAKQYDKSLEYLEKAEAAGCKVNPNFKKAVLSALGR